MSLGEFVFPLIQSLDTYNYLLKSHHRRVAVIAYAIGVQMKLSDDELNDLVIAAAIHDIGALTIQERDDILDVDVSDPKPHSEMGYKILQGFELFDNIATIISHHHAFYYESYLYHEDIPIQSYIIAVADRIEVYISNDEPILNQKDNIRNEVQDRSGELFHPQVCGAFEVVSRASSFWIMIKNMTMGELFSKLNYGVHISVNQDIIKDFATILGRIVDFRSRCTAAHSLTVGNLAQFIGEQLSGNTEFHDKLMIAGLLHDVGKFNINPSLITKQDELDEEEMEELKKVPVYNRKILGDLTTSPWFESVLEWISDSNKVTNKDTLGPRIIQLSHILTALLEQRPYRDAYDIDEALKLLEQEQITASDKEIIDFIQNHKPQIIQLITRYETDGLAFYDSIEKEFEYE